MLRQVLVKRQFEQSLIDILTQDVHLQALSKGDIIEMPKGISLNFGTKQVGVGFVRAGTLMRQVSFLDGSMTSTGILFSGHYLYVNGHNTRGSSVRYLCVENAEIEWVETKDIYQACFAYPQFLDLYVERRNLYSRLVEEYLLLRTLLSKRDHIIFTLATIFSAKLKRQEDDMKITIEDLCSITGVTRQYYSKVLSELRAEGIISNHYGRIKLFDYPALLELLEPNICTHYELYQVT